MAGARSTSIQREEAYRVLRRLLILQQVQAGARLREPEWAERLKVHRTALREAFARLEAEGLIERGPNTGYFVPVLSEEDLREITRLRLALEAMAIDEICEKSATRKDLAERVAPMRRACEDFEQFVRRNYSLGVIEADRRFHESLIQAARCRRLEMLYCRAPLPLITRHVEDPAEWRNICEESMSEHLAILDALARRDPATARSLLREHLAVRSLVPACQ